MNDEQLLSAMFADADEFREQLLGQTLRHARLKRRRRQSGQALLALATGAFALWWAIPRPATLDAPVTNGVQIVHSRPLPPQQIVTTRQDSVVMISSDKLSVAMLGDDQLLDLVPGETKLLVWHAPHDAELVIVSP